MQAGIGVDQRLDARLGILDAGREGFLRHLDEGRDRVAMRLEKGAIDDDRVAVGIEAGILPGEIAHIAAERVLVAVMQIVELGHGIHRTGHEGRQFRVGTDIHPGDRVRVHTVGLGEGGP